jgi:DNA polymerase IV (DinB-like DNA polymerase)
MDAFYASVEQREDPSIIDRPVIVGADPQGGSGRGVVASCSYEARKYGIHSATPISQAYRLCPDGVYLRPRFMLYERVSRNVMTILKKYADRFEQVSIDEAFLDVSEKVKEFPDAETLAKKIKQEVYEREMLLCSIGIAPIKIVAKIATDVGKPNGLVVVEPSEVNNFLAPLAVSKIPGVGKKTHEILQSMRINTIGDLAKTPLQVLTEKFGKHGLWMHEAANGANQGEIIEFCEPKSISSESTFENDTDDLNEIMKTIQVLVEEVHGRISRENHLFKTVGLKIRFENFKTFTRAKSLTSYTNSKEAILDNAMLLVREFEKKGKVRLLGIKVSSLRKIEEPQKKLLAWMK